MNTTTKTSFILIATLLIGVAIGALGSGLLREERTRTFDLMRPENRFLQYMKGVIRPTAEQSQKFDDILGKYSKQISNIHQQHQEEILSIYDSLHTELRALLNDEQRARLEQSLEKGHNRRIAMAVGHLTEELGLSEGQSKRIEEILLTNDFAPERGRVLHGKRQEFRRELRARFEKMEKEISDILTPQQLTKYRDMRMRRRLFMRDEPPPPFPGARPEASPDEPE